MCPRAAATLAGERAEIDAREVSWRSNHGLPARARLAGVIARPISRVRFGDCEVDFDAFTLTRAGVPIPVQRQPFDVLAVLLAQPGRVITRQELREQLWDDSFVDFDHSLNIAINKLRAALNDSADHPRYIETVPRRGYRFIGTVDLDAPEGAATAAAAPASVAEGDV